MTIRCLTLVLVLLIPVFVAGQGEPPPKGGEKKSDRTATRTRPDPEMDAWVRMLASRLGHGNEAIRRSAAAALMNIGAPAVPVLTRISRGGRSNAARSANRVLTQIRRRIRRRAAAGEKTDRPRPDRASNNGRTNSARTRIARALEALGLDGAQKKAIEQSNADRAERIREVFRQVQDGEMTREESNRETRRIRDEADAGLEKALGSELFKKYREAMRNARRNRRG